MLSGQAISIEIDLSQGTLHVLAGPVGLTGQDTNIEIDLSQGILDVQSVGAVALTGQTIAAEIDPVSWDAPRPGRSGCTDGPSH